MKETYFYVGQTVYSLDYGRGQVIEDKKITKIDFFPVVVAFEGGSTRAYTYDGRLTVEQNITLFQQPISLPTNKPIITLKKGDLVWVKDFKDTQWECRYFSHFSDFSRTIAVCFTDQKAEGDLKEWRYYSEFENIPF